MKNQIPKSAASSQLGLKYQSLALNNSAIVILFPQSDPALVQIGTIPLV